MGLGAHTIVIMKDGKLKGVGGNWKGQLGIGNNINQQKFVDIPLTGVKEISTGQAFTFFLLQDGTVKAVGGNNLGQLGLGSNVEDPVLPIKSVPIEGVKQIACGAYHTMFLMNDGTVQGVGYNDYGQLGLGATSAYELALKKNILSNVKSIGAGTYFTLFLMKDGSIKSVGQNNTGQLGNGATKLTEPIIQSIAISGVKQIATGDSHAMLLMNDGTVKGVGSNVKGQLGLGHTSSQSMYKDTLISGVKQIACGNSHTIFLMNDGTVKGVGNNINGQLGVGDLLNKSTPVTLPITGVKKIACGENYTIFLMEDGSIRAVGRGDSYQLGNEANGYSYSTIINISSISDVSKIQDNLSSLIKYLIQDGTSIKAYNNNAWSTLGEAPLTKTYLDQAMTSLSGLTNITLSQLVSSTPELLAWYEEDEGAKTLTMTGPIWEEVSTTLPTPEEMTLKGHEDLKVIPANAWADLGGDFEVVTYTNDLDEAQKLFLEAMPKSQLVQGTTDFTNVAQLALVASTGVKVIVSSDSGVTWKTRTEGTWTTIAATVDAVKVSGISVIDFNLITADQWTALGDKVRVAYLLEDEALLDKITVTKVQVTDATPSFDSMKVEYEELTLEGRLQDLERLNAINLAKLNFKANAIMQTDGYKLDDMVIDTFEKDSMLYSPIESKAIYDQTNKFYKGIGGIETVTETLLVKPKTLIVNADHTEATLQYSLDNGLSWYTITSGEVKDISGITGTELKIRANLPTATATLTALSYAWA